MAIEIIKRGQIPEEKKYRGCCSNCRTEFSFQQKDAKVSHDLRDGSFMTIACPVCKAAVYKDL